MDLRGIILSDINQLEKDKYPVISLIYGIKKKKKKRQAHKYKEQVGHCQIQGMEEWAKWVKGVKKHDQS